MKNSIKKGFTLIELMVVIAIIAILSGIILASFSAAKSRSRDGQRISDLSQIQLALAGYFNQCNDYPSPDTGNIIDSNTLTQNAGCPSGVTFASFIGKIPTPPAGYSQTNYSYAVATANGVNDDYVLEATLEGSSPVSSESLSSVPSDITGTSITCSSPTTYCLGAK